MRIIGLSPAGLPAGDAIDIIVVLSPSEMKRMGKFGDAVALGQLPTIHELAAMADDAPSLRSGGFSGVMPQPLPFVEETV